MYLCELGRCCHRGGCSIYLVHSIDSFDVQNHFVILVNWWTQVPNLWKPKMNAIKHISRPYVGFTVYTTSTLVAGVRARESRRGEVISSAQKKFLTHELKLEHRHHFVRWCWKRSTKKKMSGNRCGGGLSSTESRMGGQNRVEWLNRIMRNYYRRTKFESHNRKAIPNRF